MCNVQALGPPDAKKGGHLAWTSCERPSWDWHTCFVCLGLVMLVGALFSGATIFWTAVGLFVVGTVFYILNKVTKRR